MVSLWKLSVGLHLQYGEQLNVRQQILSCDGKNIIV